MNFHLYSFFLLRMKGNLTGTKPVMRFAIVGAEKQVAEENNENK